MNSNFEVAVLSYHGWEIDPQLVINDVRCLRNKGWQDICLEDLYRILTGQKRHSRPVFHVTSDDGTRSDEHFVAALRLLSCPATFFVCLERMDRDADIFFRELSLSSDYRIGDHSLRHDRVFQLRHVIGFHNVKKPLFSSPERLGLKLGAPICSYGPELCSPCFRPANDAKEVCQEAASRLHDAVSDHEWGTALAAALVKSGLGFYRLARLCIRGEYEARTEWEHRTCKYLAQGCDALRQFTGKDPIAFAFPWWESDDVADHQLRALGYKLTFSGRGLCKDLQPFQIPRLPITATTPRPLDLAKLDSLCPSSTTTLGSIARRLFYA